MIALRPTRLSPWVEIDAYVNAHPALHGKFGATAVFVGTARDLNQGLGVSEMVLEYYPGMTERELTRIEAEVRARWDILDSLTIHRVGLVPVADPIVVVATWAVHREAAFGACRDLMEALKHRAPFWKREQTPQGERWVEAPSGPLPESPHSNGLAR